MPRPRCGQRERRGHATSLALLGDLLLEILGQVVVLVLYGLRLLALEIGEAHADCAQLGSSLARLMADLAPGAVERPQIRAAARSLVGGRQR